MPKPQIQALEGLRRSRNPVEIRVFQECFAEVGPGCRQSRTRAGLELRIREHLQPRDAATILPVEEIANFCDPEGVGGHRGASRLLLEVGFRLGLKAAMRGSCDPHACKD